METKFDVVVVGAGIGGACAAISLVRRGARVCVLESGEMPRHKVCGEFLSPEISDVLARLGVLEDIKKARPSVTNAARVVTAQRQIGPFPLPRPAFALSRFKLDEILWRAAQNAGAQVCDRTRVRHIERDGDGFCVQDSRSQTRARFVIAAPGRHANLLGETAPQADSTMRRFIGFKTHFRDAHVARGETELHPFDGGYCGLVEVEDGLTNVCLLADYETIAGRAPEEFWAHLIGGNPALAARVQGATRAMPWLATANIVFGKFQPQQDGVLFCGDAAGFIHPLTGDGMAMAARSGELAAATIAACLRGGLARADVAPIYQSAWHREFDVRLRWGARLQPLFTTSWLTPPTMKLFARVPRLGRLAVIRTRGQ